MITRTAAVLFFTVLSGQTVNKAGTTAAKFLSIGLGSQAVGMGSAFTAMAEDASAMYWNPSGIARTEGRHLYVNHLNWIADISVDYLGVIVPIRRGKIGLSASAVTMDEMEVTRYGNEETGETFKAGSYAFGLTYALNLTDRFSIGFSGKFIQEKIANSSSQGLALDVGTLFDTPFGFRLGTSISNFGPRIQITGEDLLVSVDIDERISGNNESVTGLLSTDKFELPLLLRIGVSDDVIFGNLMKLTWAVDANYPNDNASYLNLGAQLSFLSDIAVIRGGWRALLLDERDGEFALGGGLKIPTPDGSINVNYALEGFQYLGNVHQISVEVIF